MQPNWTKKIKARIVLLNVVQANTSGETLLKWKRLEEEMVKIAREDGEQLLARSKKESRCKNRHHI
jgi:hypothetical protein